MKEIEDLLSDDLLCFVPLTKGKIAVVDRWAYDAVMQYLWSYDSDGYAERRVGKTLESLHHFIISLAGHDDIAELDHHNRDRLDCRLSNLRPATRSQNLANKGKRAIATSKFIGVS